MRAKQKPPEVCERDCPDRVCGCHAKCEKYLAFHAKQQEEYKRRKQIQELNFFTGEAIEKTRGRCRSTWNRYRPTKYD